MFIYECLFVGINFVVTIANVNSEVINHVDKYKGNVRWHFGRFSTLLFRISYNNNRNPLELNDNTSPSWIMYRWWSNRRARQIKALYNGESQQLFFWYFFGLAHPEPMLYGCSLHQQLRTPRMDVVYINTILYNCEGQYITEVSCWFVYCRGS